MRGTGFDSDDLRDAGGSTLDDRGSSGGVLAGAGRVEISDEVTEQSQVSQATLLVASALPLEIAPDHAESSLLILRDVRHTGLDVPPFTVEATATRIGRLPCATLGWPGMCELVLPHSSVSRQHAVIERTASGFVLQDSSSSNGTFVNNFRLGVFPIKRGDHLRFGNLRFIVEAPGALDRIPLAALPTEQLTARSDHDPPLSTYYRRSISDIGSYVFGVVVLRDYEELTAELSGIGVRSLETSLGGIVAHHLDHQTYAFRQLQRGSLQVVIASRAAARIDAITAEIARELQGQIADLSPGHRGVTWSTSRVDPEVAARKAIAVTPTGSMSIPEVQPAMTELRVVHLSDLHFGAGSMSWRHDHEQVMASLVRDLERDRFSAHRVFVTGDVAFSGTAEQYELARKALRRVASAVELSLASVRVVPGNHDVDRATAHTPLLAALHHHARALPVALDALLAEPRSRALLLEKLALFRAFVASLDGHPPELDWRERLVVDGARVDIWGLNSVWVSDGNDGCDARGAFSANLILGKTQYRELARDALPAEFNVVMTHHPLEWISSPHGRWLRSAFASAPSLHLCGHVHQQAGTAAVQLGKPSNSVTLVAGASHAEQDESAGHSYSRCILRRLATGHWALGWSPRAYDAERDEFRIDRRGYDLDVEGYAWFRFPGHVPP